MNKTCHNGHTNSNQNKSYAVLLGLSHAPQLTHAPTTVPASAAPSGSSPGCLGAQHLIGMHRKLHMQLHTAPSLRQDRDKAHLDHFLAVWQRRTHAA